MRRDAGQNEDDHATTTAFLVISTSRGGRSIPISMTDVNWAFLNVMCALFCHLIEVDFIERQRLEFWVPNSIMNKVSISSV